MTYIVSGKLRAQISDLALHVKVQKYALFKQNIGDKPSDIALFTTKCVIFHEKRILPYFSKTVNIYSLPWGNKKGF